MTNATITARKTSKESTIHLKGQAIKQYDLTLTDSGFEFFVATEADAYKAAYVYRNQEVRVVFAEGVSKWLVIVEKR
jgi:hypothetical protein